MIAQLEFELVYHDVAVQHICHYARRGTSLYLYIYIYIYISVQCAYLTMHLYPTGNKQKKITSLLNTVNSLPFLKIFFLFFSFPVTHTFIMLCNLKKCEKFPSCIKYQEFSEHFPSLKLLFNFLKIFCLKHKMSAFVCKSFEAF